jgi:hypothetical protein
MSSELSTQTLPKTVARLMLCLRLQGTSTLLNRGVPVEQYPVFPEFLAEELIVLAKVPLATCAARVECLHLPKHIADGIER